jgi:hypothetical protein
LSFGETKPCGVPCFLSWSKGCSDLERFFCPVSLFLLRNQSFFSAPTAQFSAAFPRARETQSLPVRRREQREKKKAPPPTRDQQADRQLRRPSSISRELASLTPEVFPRAKRSKRLSRVRVSSTRERSRRFGDVSERCAIPPKFPRSSGSRPASGRSSARASARVTPSARWGRPVVDDVAARARLHAIRVASARARRSPERDQSDPRAGVPRFRHDSDRGPRSRARVVPWSSRRSCRRDSRDSLSPRCCPRSRASVRSRLRVSRASRWI